MAENKILLKQIISQCKVDSSGLVPTIVQDASTRKVLMLAYSNSLSILTTLKTGEAHFYSRSRQELWHKGATSGNRLIVHKIALDCDQDTLLFFVEPLGPACHTGHESCFFEQYDLRKGSSA